MRAGHSRPEVVLALTSPAVVFNVIHEIEIVFAFVFDVWDSFYQRIGG